MKLRPKRTLLEHVEVNGATFINTVGQYDVFRILNWNAAEQFILDNDENTHAGTFYVSGESTFNDNINDAVRLFFITNIDTNKVPLAIVTGAGNGSVKFVNDESTTISVDLVNTQIETSSNHTNIIEYNQNINLRSILDLISTEAGLEDDIIPNTLGCKVLNEEGKLKGLIPQLATDLENQYVTSGIYSEIEVGDNQPIKGFVNNKVFSFGLSVHRLILHRDVENVPSHICDKVEQIDCLDMSEAPTNWSESWNAGKQDVTTFIPSEDELVDDEDDIDLDGPRDRDYSNPSEDDFEDDDLVGFEDDFDLEDIDEYEDENTSASPESTEPDPHFIEEVDETIELLSKCEPLTEEDFAKTDFLTGYYNCSLEGDNWVINGNSYRNEAWSNTISLLRNRISMCDNLMNDRKAQNCPEEKINELIELKEKITQYIEDAQNKLNEIKNDQSMSKLIEWNISRLRYKVEGKGITILGLKTFECPKSIYIPKEINGKEVTKISSYAFYDQNNLCRLYIPTTVKLIEKGATTGTNVNYDLLVRTDCIVGSGNPDVEKTIHLHN